VQRPIRTSTGTTVDPDRIQDVINNPANHVRELTLPSIEDKLTERIRQIRDAVIAKRNGSRGESKLPVVEERDRVPGDPEPEEQPVDPDEPESATERLEDTEPFDLDSVEVAGTTNGDGASGPY
jgi:hypothetical protein